MKKILKYFLVNRCPKFVIWCLSILPFLIYFFDIDKSPGFDWRYFNSLGLVNKSFVNELLFPVIDIKECGGFDLAANPQNYLFSPFFLLLFILSPYFANLSSILLLSYVAYVYMGKIIEKYDSSGVRFLGGALFCLAPFFSLHFAEGHIPYRSFFLIPVLYYLFIEELSISNFRKGLVIATFSLLDGGMYFIFFFMFLAPVMYICHGRSFLKDRNLFDKKTLLIIFALSLIVLAKVFPSLFMHGDRIAVVNNGVFSFYDIINSMFNILNTNLSKFGHFPYRAHEYAHYIPLSLISLFLLTIVRSKNKRGNYVLLGIVFWTYTGIGGWFNPWTIYKLIPILNNAHIQSRFSIYFFFFLLLFVCRSSISKRVKYGFLLIAFVELVAQNVIVYHSLWSKTKLIPHSEYSYQQTHNVEKFSKYVPKPFLYNSNALSHFCYEPALSHKLAHTVRITLSSKEQITFSQIGMNSLLVSSHRDLPSQLLLNLGYGAGWECDYCETRNHDGLLFLENINSRKSVIISYRPFYLSFILATFTIGLILLILVWRKY